MANATSTITAMRSADAAVRAARPTDAALEDERVLGVIRGVEGPELAALSKPPRQSKSEHVPTRRQTKHQRVRQLSWYTMLQPPACSTMVPQRGHGLMRGATASRRLVSTSVQGAPQTRRPHNRVLQRGQATGRAGARPLPPEGSSKACATPGQSEPIHAMPPVRRASAVFSWYTYSPVPMAPQTTIGGMGTLSYGQRPPQ